MKKWIAALLAVQLCAGVQAQKPLHTFALGESAFLLDGKPFQMISAEIHYPRVPREAWRQRMRMAKAMGINTIGTYVFWNVHEPQKGTYDFAGNNDIAAFVKIAAEEGLWIVLRPSPYVCAEWEFGGYPYWLQKEKGLVVRSREAGYIKAYENYIRQVGKQLAPLQVNKGGNIIMVQVENEYGSYASDKDYLEQNRQLFIRAGFDGILYTCDPARDVAKGYLPGLLPAVNGIDDPAKIQAMVKQYHNGKGPFYVAEWYPAWFDWWGEKHHTVPAEHYTGRLDTLLAAGISINMYMFHGGTTRGFMNGANYYDSSGFQPQVSSYDYDAPLDEAGNATDKFMQFRQVIQKHLPAGAVLPLVPVAKPVIAIHNIQFQQQADVFSVLPKPVTAAQPLTFEQLNQDYGYVLYRTRLPKGEAGVLKIKELRDYGIVFVNGKRQGVVDRMLHTDSLAIEAGSSEQVIDILVENLGRINFGKYLLQNTKGITQQVTLNGKVLTGWQMYSLPMNSVKGIVYNNKPGKNAPVLKKGSFTLTKTGDTYLNLSNWGKGCIWVNGHNLGRYWNKGPQQTVYLPVEWLKKGANEVVIFEMITPEQNSLEGLEKPILDQLK
ncbi:beta-galactosidase [Filimonas lacunae]|uniref:Beta-galactosidase n=1 Tax=Filimonas lacunae TaxID=477680 RepID=A0A173MMM7_9BACT|nr:beta-galactosidase family protein [Filimonas lacunae]BAV08905.1 beta-galactosidase [Filimonas lacunae]SIS63770.1 beta-galactosidase [Filimonas lacunae]